MPLTFRLLFLALLLTININCLSQETLLDTNKVIGYINTTDVIGTIQFEEYETNSRAVLRYLEVFKGTVRKYGVLQVSNSCLVPGEQYLIFARYAQVEEYRILVLDSCTFAI